MQKDLWKHKSFLCGWYISHTKNDRKLRTEAKDVLIQIGKNACIFVAFAL